MTHPLRRTERWKLSPWAGVAVVLTAAIFVLDTVTPLEIAMAVFYVAVVLIAMRFMAPRGVTWVAGGCIVLAIISFLLTPRGSPESGLWNLAIGVAAIAATTYLARKMVAAEASAHEARAQLARLAGITALGELTASIAHEVNQPLTAIVASGDAGLRWLAAEPPNVARASRTMERMIGDAKRASEFVGRVRAMARGAPTQKQWLDLNAAVREVVSLMDEETRAYGIGVRARLSDKAPVVFADPIQIQQVLLNLVANAVESLSAVGDRSRDLVITTSRRSDEARLAVTDNGLGLPSEEIETIFEPFVTRKPGGMGIGLAISRSIVESHGGRIWAVRNAPHGLTIEFTLPGAKGQLP